MSRRRRAFVALGMVAGLLLPIAAASADTGGPPDPSGRSMNSYTPTRCDATQCTVLQFDVAEQGTTRSLCLELDTTSLDGQTIYTQSFGCNFDTVGSWRVIGGYITGVTDTTVTLFDTNGGSRDVVVSAKTALAGEATATIEKIDGSDQNCTITWTVKERRIPVAGTVTVDGVVFATGSDSVSVIRNVKEKSSC